MRFHRIKNVIIFIISIYLIFTALVSLFYVSMAFTKLESLDIITVPFLLLALFIVSLTLWANADTLLDRKIHKSRNILINLIICAMQSISIFSEGFCYKFVQGFEWVGFIHFDKSTWKFEYGAFFSQFIYEFLFNFRDANGLMIGTNFITLLLTVFFGFLLIKKKEIEVTT